jgi:hypothetical protein
MNKANGFIGQASDSARLQTTIDYDWTPTAAGSPHIKAGEIAKYSNDLADRTIAGMKTNMGASKFDDLVTKMGYPDETAFRAGLAGKMRTEARQIIKPGKAVEKITKTIGYSPTGQPITVDDFVEVYKPGTINVDDSVTIARRSLEKLDPPTMKVATAYADDAVDAAVRARGTELIAQSDDILKGLSKRSTFGKIKTALRGIFTWKFLSGLLKGLGIAAAGQAGGFFGTKIYWENMFTNPLADPEVNKLNISTGVTGDGIDNDDDGSIDEEICDGFDNDKDGKIDEDCGDTIDKDLHNGMTYRIDITENGPHNITWTIKKVVPGGGPLGFDTMSKLLKEKTATTIEGDCSGKFAQRGVQDIFGPYIISPENAKLVGLDNALYYLKPVNNEIILNAAVKYKLSLAPLLAAIFESNAHRKPDVKEQVNAVAEELSKTDLERFAKAHKLDSRKVEKTANTWADLPTITEE